MCGGGWLVGVVVMVAVGEWVTDVGLAVHVCVCVFLRTRQRHRRRTRT